MRLILRKTVAGFLVALPMAYFNAPSWAIFPLIYLAVSMEKGTP